MRDQVLNIPRSLVLPEAAERVRTLGVRFKSLHEEMTARILTGLGVQWEYESSAVMVGENDSEDTRYVPDFWCSEFGTYIECKQIGVRGVIWRAEKPSLLALKLAGEYPDPFEPNGLEVVLIANDTVYHHDKGYCAGDPWCEQAEWRLCGNCDKWWLGALCNGRICRICDHEYGRGIVRYHENMVRAYSY